MGTAAYPGSDWSSEGRPIIRPPVGSAMSGSMPPPPPERRRPATIPAMSAEDLGIEESEFDKPTYLRRTLAAHGDPSGSR